MFNKLMNLLNRKEKKECAMSILKRNRKTKIVSTIGPVSENQKTIDELFQAGADVFRLNFSHGTHEEHAERVRMIREAEKKFGRPVTIFADMQGPKLRLGVFANDKIEVSKGHKIILDSDPTPGDEKRVCLPHPEILEVLEVGANVLVDDGNTELVVTAKDPANQWVECEVVAGKWLKTKKGVNLPSVLIKRSIITEKDRKDLVAACKMDLDWIGLSFVQRPEDITEARQIMGDNGKKIIAKIEKPSAVELFDEIVKLTDAVMVARGDLGVEIPPEKVPSVQKRIINVCRAEGKPVIVATQMLDSMIGAPRPTRAEVTDVATAVYDGTDAIMLSGETAFGDYPIEAVTIMDKIAQDAEKNEIYKTVRAADQLPMQPTSSDAIAAAAVKVADNVGAKVIVAHTTSGSTALRIARTRPGTPVLCLTSDKIVARRLQLSFGINAVYVEGLKNFEDIVAKAQELVKEKEMAKAGDTMVISAGYPVGVVGSTNILHTVEVK